MIQNIASTSVRSSTTPPSAEDVLLAKVMDDYLAALQSGQPIEVEYLTTAHPQLADDIRSFAESLDLLHGSTKELSSEAVGAESQTESGAKRLGDFEMGQEIGRGGMGVVYEARQISLQRRVALKVLPFAAMWDQKQIARFRNEAQAAASLHHPHIVPVFAVGQERGVHFYAMQLIDGQSLDTTIRQLQCEQRRCAEKKSPASRELQVLNSTVQAHTTHLDNVPASTFFDEFSSDRTAYFRSIAELGIQAAEALHHAHECGVLHRDIKPSNLLVDHSGKLWITDFGLARMENSAGVTVTGDVVGTLRYMSPEQAAGEQVLVDQRTDIYALGATLYELLTLQPAFPGEDRNEILRAIQQQEPTPPRKINSSIPVDLETIVLVAMAKSREDRYDTAQGLANDLKRLLAGKPTSARRPSVVDRANKWLRRHRLAAAAAAVVLVAITSISTVGALLLAQETAEKEAALLVAEKNLRQARTVVDRFGSAFSRELEKLPGSEPLRRALLQDTLDYYQEFISRAENDPELRDELANTTVQAANIASRLGRQTEAQELYRSALALFAGLAKTTDDAEQLQENRAACLNNLALILDSLGENEASRTHYTEAIALQSALIARGEPVPGQLSALAEMHTNLGLLQRRGGDSSGARQSLQHAIKLLSDLVERYPDDARHAHGLAIALNNRSFVQQATDWTEAEASCQAAVDILRRLADQSAEDTDLRLVLRSDLALCLNNRGAIKSHLADYPSACNSYRSAIALQQQLSRQAPAVVRYRSDLAISWNNLGQAFAAEDDSLEAGAAFDRSEAMLVELVDDHPADVRFRSCLAGVLNNQAMALERAGQTELALTKYERAIQHQCFASEKTPQEKQYREFLSKHFFNYGRVLRSAGRGADAASVAMQRRELWPAHGERLFHVAQELALAAEQLAERSTDAEGRALYDQIVEEVLITLQQAESAGYRPSAHNLNQDEFRSLKHLPKIHDLLTGKQ